MTNDIKGEVNGEILQNNLGDVGTFGASLLFPKTSTNYYTTKMFFENKYVVLGDADKQHN